MITLYTIKSIEWEVVNDTTYIAKNTVKHMAFYRSLVDLETYSLYTDEFTPVAQAKSIEEIKEVAEKYHQKLLLKYLNPVT